MPSDKRKLFHFAGCLFAALSLADVLGMEFGYIDRGFGDSALTVLIVCLAVVLAINFYLKNRKG